MHPISIRVLAFAVSLVVGVIPAALAWIAGWTVTGGPWGAWTAFAGVTALMSWRTADNLADYCADRARKLPEPTRETTVWATGAAILVGIPCVATALMLGGGLIVPALAAGPVAYSLVAVTLTCARRTRR